MTKDVSATAQRRQVRQRPRFCLLVFAFKRDETDILSFAKALVLVLKRDMHELAL